MGHYTMFTQWLGMLHRNTEPDWLKPAEPEFLQETANTFIAHFNRVIGTYYVER